MSDSDTFVLLFLWVFVFLTLLVPCCDRGCDDGNGDGDGDDGNDDDEPNNLFTTKCKDIYNFVLTFNGKSSQL